VTVELTLRRELKGVRRWRPRSGQPREAWRVTRASSHRWVSRSQGNEVTDNATSRVSRQPWTPHLPTWLVSTDTLLVLLYLPYSTDTFDTATLLICSYLGRLNGPTVESGQAALRASTLCFCADPGMALYLLISYARVANGPSQEWREGGMRPWGREKGAGGRAHLRPPGGEETPVDWVRPWIPRPWTMSHPFLDGVSLHPPSGMGGPASEIGERGWGIVDQEWRVEAQAK